MPPTAPEKRRGTRKIVPARIVQHLLHEGIVFLACANHLAHEGIVQGTDTQFLGQLRILFMKICVPANFQEFVDFFGFSHATNVAKGGQNGNMNYRELPMSERTYGSLA
jgi:hypothetical protein